MEVPALTFESGSPVVGLIITNVPRRVTSPWVEGMCSPCFITCQLPSPILYSPSNLTPATKENVSLDDLIHTWMTRLSGECLFISALEKTGYDTLRQVLYNKVRELHVQKYPYNDFLFEHYEE